MVWYDKKPTLNNKLPIFFFAGGILYLLEKIVELYKFSGIYIPVYIVVNIYMMCNIYIMYHFSGTVYNDRIIT